MARSTILYVEDEEFDVFFMRRAFTQAGLQQQLLVASDGQKAIHLLSDAVASAQKGEPSIPCLVLLDLNLPIISGFQVLEWMKRQPELRQIPVVILSSSARPDDKTKASSLGAIEYLAKPRSGMDFPAVVQVLQQKWLPQPEATNRPIQLP